MVEPVLKGGIQISKFQKTSNPVVNRAQGKNMIQFAPRVSSPNLAHTRTNISNTTATINSGKIYVSAGPRNRVPPGSGPGSLRQTPGGRPFRSNPVRMNGPNGPINGPTGNGPHGSGTGRINGEGRTVIGTKTVGGQSRKLR